MEAYPWLRHYAPDTSPHIDYPKKSIFQMFEETVSKYPGLTCTIFVGAKLSFSQVRDQAEKLASALSRMGVKKGDRVAVMLPNSPMYVISYLAILRLGAIVVQVNPLYTERELGHLLEDSQAKVIIVLDLMYPKVEKVRPGMPWSR